MTGAAPLQSLMIDAKIASGYTSAPVNVLGYQNLTAYLVGNGTTSSGAVTFEEATFDPSAFGTGGYTGTWAAIGSAVNPSSNTQVATHFTAGAYHWIRCRISTVIGGGGSVTVTLVGNPS